jgi:uroporphyrinogen decarboxylase
MMISRERVIATIRRQPVDRMPRYGWLGNLETPIAERFGSLAAFEDAYGFDMAHAFGNPWQYTREALSFIKGDSSEALPERVIQAPIHDPDDPEMYKSIVAQIKHHKTERGRFVYVQSPGLFEGHNGLFGIENHMMYLMLYPEALMEVYKRQSEWTTRWAMNCLDLGVDMIHISDDWGAQNDLMFSPDTWWQLIYPNHKRTIDAVKRRGAFASLHSDGNVNSVLDGIAKLGFDVVHPFQESAGMDLARFKRDHPSSFTVLGGIDVQTTLGFGNLPHLRSELVRVVGMFRDGGLILCTTHAVQDHCSLEELVYCYDTVVELCGG